MESAPGALLFALAGPLWMAVRRVLASRGQGGNGDKECAEVAAVLSYWFDGNTSQNYKYKWFPSSNGDIQDKADREVTDHFSALLQLATTSGLGHWGESSRAMIAKIIVLGKFSPSLVAGSRHCLMLLCAVQISSQDIFIESFPAKRRRGRRPIQELLHWPSSWCCEPTGRGPCPPRSSCSRSCHSVTRARWRDWRQC